MSRDLIAAALRNPWWAIVALAFSLGASVSAFKAHETAQDEELARKADSVDVANLTRAVQAQTAAMSALNQRLSLFICDGKPRYCQ